jgi:Holliday junction resolvasome RuvABC endonuclease subunit
VILGVDPGYAKCGWAVVDRPHGRVLALGLIVTTQDKSVDKSTDRARRVADVCTWLHTFAVEYGCTTIAAEQALGHGAADAVAANQLPWGGVIAVALALGAELVEVKAKVWQHAVLGIETGKVDYEKVEADLGSYVDAQAADVLKRIKKADRNHALDAVGVGLLAALRPHLTATIVPRRSKAPLHVERKDVTT